MLRRCGLYALVMLVFVGQGEAGQGPFLLQHNTPSQVIYFPLYELDGIELNDTPAVYATGDVKVTLDGGTNDNIDADTFTHEGEGVYSITLSAAETNGARTFVTIRDQTAPQVWLDTVLLVETYGNASAQHAFDLDDAEPDVNVAAISADSGAADNLELMYDGAGYAGGTAKLTVDVVKIAGTTQDAIDLADFAAAGYDPATDKVQGVVLADTVTTLTGHTAQTGDNYARLGAPVLASVSADIAGVRSISLSIFTDTNDMQPKLGTPAADLAADIAAIEAQTDDIGALGVGLTGLVDDIWDEPLSGHTTTGTTGRAIDDLPNTAIFFTNFASGGSVSSITYWNSGTSEPSNKVLTGGTSDDDSITFTIEIHVLHSNEWQPDDVELYKDDVGTSVAQTLGNWTQIDDRVYTTTLAYGSASAAATYHVQTDDGKGVSQDFAYVRSLDPPLVLTAVIDNHSTTTGGDPHCPLAQTQASASDTLDISGTAESHANEVYVKDYEVTTGESLQGPYTVTAGVWSGTINTGTGNNATANYKAYAKVTGGTAGADFISSESVDLNQTVPTFSSVGHSYPGSQEALKDTETDTVTITHTNIEAGDDYVYDDNSTGELTIPATTTYSASKAVDRLSGDYRESGTNYRLTVTRLQKNGLAATKGGTVKIAHTAPTLTVTPDSTNNNNRFGTGDGTPTYRDRTITLTSSQANLSTHTATLCPAAGDTSAFTSSCTTGWSTSGDLAYTNTFRVEDGDINGGGQGSNNFNWITISVKNRAGKETTTIGTNPDYAIGGFQDRTFTHPIVTDSPNHEIDIGVLVVDTTRLDVRNNAKAEDQTYEGSIVEHEDPDPSNNNYFTISNGSDVFDADNQWYHNSDKLWYETITTPGPTITIGEDP